MGRKYPSDKAEKRRVKRSDEQRWRDDAETYIDEAAADLEKRELEDRPYEDAMEVSELLSEATAAATRCRHRDQRGR